jgi:non-specific serine/threonine protein kinase
VHYALDFGAALRDGQAKRRGQALSIREREVAALLARGFSNQQIGATLFITEKTAAHHVQHILDKLAFRSRAQVAAWAVRQGLAREDSNR